MITVTQRASRSDSASVKDLVDGIAHVAARTPRRTAFQVSDQRTTYGQLRAAIDGMRLVTQGQGMSDTAAVVAAVLHCAPSIANTEDPGQQAQQLDAVMEHMLRDPAVRDGQRAGTVATATGELDYRAVATRVESRRTA